MNNEQEDIVIKGVRRPKEMLTPRAELERARTEFVYWWYMTLKLSESYRECCNKNGEGDLAETFKRFGDIFNIYDTFDQWWFNRGRTLLQLKKPTASVELIKNYSAYRKAAEDNDFLVFAIPLTIRKETAIRKVRDQLNKAHEARYRGKTISIHEVADIDLKYQKSKIRHEMIELLLKLYKIHKRRPKAKLAELADAIDYVPDLFLRTTKDLEHITPTYEQKILHRRKTIAVSRYLKQAENLVYNAERGIFPSIKKMI